MPLKECRECGKPISTEATTCPSCGCPQHPMSGLPDPKETPAHRSHVYGVIALIAFVMSNFIPAILAPMFVLVGFVFAVLELSRASKAFGSIMFALCVFQTWFIADHFYGVSGALGITNPKQIDASTATKYSTMSVEITAAVEEIIQQECERKWPNDFNMRRYCQNQQHEGVATLSHGRPTSVSQEAYTIIRGKCAQEWPRDFQMRAYCEGQQYDSYSALLVGTADRGQRGSCAQKWPDDYQMRQYCETH